jgi:hypothetical protein
LMVTEVTGVLPELAAKIPPVEDDERVTVVFDETFTGLFEALSTWTTIAPSVALLDAAPDTGEVVITSFVAVTTTLTTVSDIPDPQVLTAVLLFVSPAYDTYHQ